MKCEIDDARMFLQVVKETSNPLTVIREALSNSSDAMANKCKVVLHTVPENRVNLEIHDNGNGMTREGFRFFFGLGFGSKEGKSLIGNKGLGTKLYFNSDSIQVRTRTPRGVSYQARVDSPLESLEQGVLPTYTVKSTRPLDIPYKKGTSIMIEGLRHNSRSSLLSFDSVVNYLQFYTVAGSCSRYFGATDSRLLKVDFHKRGKEEKRCMINEHLLPGYPKRQSEDYQTLALPFNPFSVDLIDDSDKELGRLKVIGSIVGPRGHTITDRHTKKRFKGVFLARDYFIIRDVNAEVFGGTGEWQSVHIVANCQNLKLSISRDDFLDRDSGGVYSETINALREFVNCMRRGDRFRYRGRTIEMGHHYAGQLYSQLKTLKKQLSESDKSNLRSMNLMALSGRPKTLLADDGGPVFEPSDPLGIALVFQGVVSKNMTFEATNEKRPATRFRVLGTSGEDSLQLIVQRREGQESWGAPMFYKPVVSNAHLRTQGMNDIDGLICWSANSIDVSCCSKSLDVVFLSDLSVTRHIVDES